MSAAKRLAMQLGVALAAIGTALLLSDCGSSPPRDATTAAPQPVAPATALPKSDAATVATLERALNGASRSEANRARDVYRHPRQTLEFFGLRADQTVMEIWPGAAGWYTEILAPLLRDHGRYIAAGPDPHSELAIEQDGIRAYRAKLDADPATYRKVEVTALKAPGALTPVPPGSVDLIVTFRNLHNWLARDTAAPMLAAMHAALKPGGVLGVVDHRADPNAPIDPHARSGYVNQQFAIELLRRAGFEFVAASEINANPMDTHDYEQGVWTLPPTWRLGDKDRERYAAIGESDRFTLKFRKPAR